MKTLWAVYCQLDTATKAKLDATLQSADLLEYWQKVSQIEDYDLRQAPPTLKRILFEGIPSKPFRLPGGKLIQIEWLDEFTADFPVKNFLQAAYDKLDYGPNGSRLYQSNNIVLDG
ncbi:hypothetical protein [Spirosoma harenae]